MPAPNRCQLSAVPKQILLDRGQRAVTPRSTKVNGPSEAGPATVHRTPPRPGRSGDADALGLNAKTSNLNSESVPVGHTGRNAGFWRSENLNARPGPAALQLEAQQKLESSGSGDFGLQRRLGEDNIFIVAE